MDYFPDGGICDQCGDSVFPESVNVEAYELSGKLLCEACAVALTALEREAKAEPVAWPVAWKVLIPRGTDVYEIRFTSLVEQLREMEAKWPLALVEPLYASPPAPNNPDGWQPIETAPTDRQMVMLIARYPTGTDWTDIHNGWRNSDGDWTRWTHNFPPTHWMPLPSPPALEDSKLSSLNT